MDKLFTIGPCQMFPEVLKQKGQIVPYFRNDDFSEKVLYVSNMIKNTMNAQINDKVILLTSSGTGAMESVIENCFSNEDKLLVINGGTFGNRFCKLCEYHQIPFDSVILPFGEKLEKFHLEKYEGNKYTALLVNLHETSTGQLYDVEMLSQFCKQNNMFFVVDAISTYLCDEYDVSKYGIDLTIISSQKGLCCSPGLAFVVMSERLNEYRKEKSSSSYFDYDDYLLNMTRGQTPYTPAVGILLEIATMYKVIERKGLSVLLNNIKMNAQFFRNNLIKCGCYVPEFPKSNAITPILFSQPIAKDVYSYLYREKHIFVNPCGGELSNRMLRVAHIGNLTVEDHKILIREIERFIIGERK